ncbi:MAG: AbrB/MazE/SpoVT family DNA-binding domain-containing protein [Patescibacteria group bacterium]
MLGLSQVNTNGQITVSKKIRDLLGIKIKDKVLITVDGRELRVIPIKGSIMDLGGSLKSDVTVKDYKRIEDQLFEDYAKDFVKKKLG